MYPEQPAMQNSFWKKTLNTARKRVCTACSIFIFTDIYIYYVI